MRHAGRGYGTCMALCKCARLDRAHFNARQTYSICGAGPAGVFHSSAGMQLAPSLRPGGNGVAHTCRPNHAGCGVSIDSTVRMHAQLKEDGQEALTDGAAVAHFFNIHGGWPMRSQPRASILGRPTGARRRGASRANVRSMRAHWAGLTCGAGQDRTRRLRATSRALVPVCGLGRRKIRLDIKALTAISRVRIRACHVHTPAARCARRQGHRATTCLPTAATTIEEAQPARV